MRRIGVLLPAAADDAEFQARVGAFLQGLPLLGWTIGRNVRIDIRWAHGQCRRNSQTRGGIGRARARRHSGPRRLSGGAVVQATRTVPIVFRGRPRSGRTGFVDSLARPGGNATGFMAFEYSLSGKWLELLKADRAGRDASGGASRSRHQPPGSASLP